MFIHSSKNDRRANRNLGKKEKFEKEEETAEANEYKVGYVMIKLARFLDMILVIRGGLRE